MMNEPKNSLKICLGNLFNRYMTIIIYDTFIIFRIKKPTVNEDGIISETNGNGLKIKDMKIKEYK